jgi:hypothetical protein
VNDFGVGPSEFGVKSVGHDHIFRCVAIHDSNDGAGSEGLGLQAAQALAPAFLVLSIPNDSDADISARFSREIESFLICDVARLTGSQCSNSIYGPSIECGAGELHEEVGKQDDSVEA